MAPSAKDISFCVLSMGLGAWAFLKTQEVTAPMFEPILAACQNSDIPLSEFTEKTGYHVYDPRWGFGAFNIFVCLITQFLHELVQTKPAGALVWMTTMLVAVPVSVLMTIEAGRKDARGPVRYPMIVSLFYQIFGVSVIFPLVWIPSYILGRGSGGVSIARVYASIPLMLPGIVLSVLVFLLDIESALWTSCAGILGGPAIVLLNALLWVIKAPDPLDLKAAKKSAEITTMAYAASGMVSLAAWLWLVFLVAIPHFGLNATKVYNSVWGEANPAVQFMTIDAMVLWLATLIVIAYQKDFAGLEALGLSFLFGPGAGPALVIAGLQVDDEARLNARNRQGQLEAAKAKETKKGK
jgi:hypothetical protein